MKAPTKPVEGEPAAALAFLSVIPAGNLLFARPTTVSLTRWLKFNLVGLMGAAVQLTSLASLNRLLPHHYLVTSTPALEVTLLHNFTWHIHYTWRDRRKASTRLQQLTRFHLSNGIVSLLGNLALMRLLVHRAHLPVLAANAIAILCCSVLNYLVANDWTFPILQP